jgi:hypothetical protein
MNNNIAPGSGSIPINAPSSQQQEDVFFFVICAVLITMSAFPTTAKLSLVLAGILVVLIWWKVVSNGQGKSLVNELVQQ